MSKDLPKPMPKEICCSNLLTCENYIKSVLPEIPRDRLFEGIIENDEFLTTSEQTGNVVPVTADFLLNANNWVSTKLETRVYQNTVAILNDPDAVYKAGKHIFKTALFGRLALILRIMPVKTIISRTPKEDAKFNRVKDVEIVSNSNGYGIVRLHWHKNTEVTKLTCDINRGIYEGLGTLTKNPVSVKEEVCHFEGGKYCEYHIRWKAKPFFSRMVDLYRFWISREIIEELESKIEEINDFRINQDRVIELRTKELKMAQAKLIKAEKRTLEHRITGGFAHEMRNALAGAQLEFKTTLNYKDQGKPSAEILKESATGLLKNISDLHEEFNIPREKIARLVLPQLKTIAEIADHLSGVHSDVSKDLDRGLSITTQIRDYARMSELKPGDQPIDLIKLLKDYEHRYRQDFERIGITYLVEGVEEAVVKAEEIHLDSIFGNLIRNAKDALEEVETDGPKEIKVTVEKREDETGEAFCITVADNGPGIPEESLSEIFEPFYSTKPTTGTGLGLGVVKRLVKLYGGTIQVESEKSKTTEFIVTLPPKREW